MKLFYIDKQECNDVTIITDRIKKVYQLEREFYPYLSVEFLSNKKYKGGIFILYKNYVVHKKYFLDTINEYNDIKSQIWYIIDKFNITKNNQSINNIDKRNDGINNVSISWKEIIEKARNAKIMIPNIMLLKNDNIKEPDIRHPVYKYRDIGIENKNSCMDYRIKECDDNYPQNSQIYMLCKDNIEWLCNNSKLIEGYDYKYSKKWLIILALVIIGLLYVTNKKN